MVSMEQAAAMAAAFPGVTEGARFGNRTWFVGKQAFAWERPFSKADIKRFGDEPVPTGPILAITVEDLGEKEAVIVSDPNVFFTIAHFEGYAAVLVHLDGITEPALRTALEDAWLVVAPTALAEAFLAGDT